MYKCLTLFLIISSLYFLLSDTGLVSAGEISYELETKINNLASETEVPVIISMREKASWDSYGLREKHERRVKLVKALKEKSKASQKHLRSLLEKRGTKHIKDLWIINSISVKISIPLIEELSVRPDVENIRLDQELSLPDAQYVYQEQAEWNLQMITADVLWDLGITGQNIIVASMDSGVDLAHADLYPKWRGDENSWYDPHGEHDQPYDATGHGTQVMGIMVGGNATGSVIGVAPDANWIAVKIFNDAGKANFSDIHLGFQWLLDPDDDPNTDDAPDIVNNSWGLKDNVNECILEFYDDIQVLKAAGIAVVFAAGNEGPQDHTSISPANYNNTFSVGSVDSSSSISDFSSRGPSSCYGDIYPLVAAPGEIIKTSDLTGRGAFPNSYAYVSGTSFAAPHVSGAMALLLSEFTNLNVTQLENSLILSTADLGDVGPDNNYGYGLINVAEAYELANSACPADFNGDYNVDSLDLVILITEWLMTNCTNCRSDLNGDQKVDFCDYTEFANHYKQANCP